MKNYWSDNNSKRLNIYINQSVMKGVNCLVGKMLLKSLQLVQFPIKKFRATKSYGGTTNHWCKKPGNLGTCVHLTVAKRPSGRFEKLSGRFEMLSGRYDMLSGRCEMVSGSRAFCISGYYLQEHRKKIKIQWKVWNRSCWK